MTNFKTMPYLTLEEQETRAYLAGDTALANALAQVIDQDKLFEEIENLENQVEQLTRDLAEVSQ